MHFLEAPTVIVKEFRDNSARFNRLGERMDVRLKTTHLFSSCCVVLILSSACIASIPEQQTNQPVHMATITLSPFISPTASEKTSTPGQTVTPLITWPVVNNNNQPTRTPFFPPPEGFEEYRPKSIESMVKENIKFANFPDSFSKLTGTNSSTLTPLGTFNIFPVWQPFAATVEYSAMLRPLNNERAMLIWQLSSSFGDDRLVDVYKQELLVREGESEYWMPIQDVLIPFLEEELIKGQQITIYARMPAILFSQNGPEFIFLINEFHR